MNNEKLNIMAQAFYGNRTATTIKRERIDSFILGNLDGINGANEKINRTIINVPNTNGIVIVYNKYQEENEIMRREKLLREKNYELKPLVVIPEYDIKLYSRCIVCRMNNGELESLYADDYEKFANYLTE